MSAAPTPSTSIPSPRRVEATTPTTLTTTGGADADLDQLWLRGDESALDQVSRRYRTRLEAVAYRILRDRDDAQDVIQRVFLALRGASYSGRASLWTYLYRSAVNGSVNVLRSQRRRAAAESRLLAQHKMTPPPAHHSPEAQVLEGEMLAQVAQALLHVKPQHRRVLTLRILHGLTNTEIADREGLPLPTVGTWLRRGREELQRALRPMLDELRRTPR